MCHLISRHDEVIKWKHFPRNWPFVRGIHWSPVNSPYKGQWRGALMFSLINVWINGRVNNRKAGIWDAILPIMTSLYENVPSDWPLSLHEDYSVVSRTTFLATVQWLNKKLQQVIERKLDTTTIILFFWGGEGVTVMTITSYFVVQFSSFMYQKVVFALFSSDIIGFYLIL